MIEMAFAAEDLVHTRFAISPLWEAVASVRALRDPGAHALHLPWVEMARPRTGDLDLRPLDALLGGRGGYTPDFLTPPPGTPLPDLDAELQRLRATPPREVRRELSLRFPSRGMPAVLRPLVADTEAELGHIVVSYAIEPRLQIAVPVRMQERYGLSRTRSVLVADATYSNYRRFETAVRLIVPKGLTPEILPRHQP